ncbi:MAG: prolipoprotein diacylglyceryl transferase [Candidatus Binatia bacterium]
MVPVLIDLGPVALHTFGAMMALAFLIAGYVVSIEFGRKGMDPEDAWSVVLWAAVGGVVGARIFVIFSDWQGFLDQPLAFLLTGSGFIWYGGLIGGFLSVSAFILRRGLSWLAAVDCIAPALALGQAIGRVGCQISGDGDWGTPTRLPWAMRYPDAVIGWEAWTRSQGLPADVTVHPAPVYETLAYCAIFLLLWRLRDRGLADGSLLWLYLVMASVARFLVEIVRIEPVVAAGLTQAQWLAIVLALAGTAMLFRATREPRSCEAG